MDAKDKKISELESKIKYLVEEIRRLREVKVSSEKEIRELKSQQN